MLSVVVRRCDQCCWWTPLETEGTVPKGQCHVEPPLSDEDGCCWPETFDSDFCSRFKLGTVDEEILVTDLPMIPGLSSETRRLCHTLHIRTVADMLQLGRVSFAVSGSRHASSAIVQISNYLSTLGIEW